MRCELVRSFWLFREFRVIIEPDVLSYQVIYNGRGKGCEYVYVNGEKAAGGRSWLWFVPSFEFHLGNLPAALYVRVWPWLAVRSLKLVVDGQALYEE